MCYCDVVHAGKNLYNNEHVAIKLVIFFVVSFCMFFEVMESLIKVVKET